jgi:hypothetical protein
MSASPVRLGDPNIPLPVLLARVAEELGALGGLAEDLQAAVGELARSAMADAAAVEDVQQMDALAQRLQALSAFTGRISGAAPASWRVDAGPAIAAVPLSALAARLAGVEPAGDDEPSGDLDFFGDGL